MSGLEVIGVVLGLFPLVLHGLQEYREVMERAKRFKEIQHEYSKWNCDLQYQEVVFRRNLQSLLLPTLVDDTQVQALMAAPLGPGWKERELAAVLKDRLGDAFGIYMQRIGDMISTLQELNQELRRDSDSIQTQLASLPVATSHAFASLFGLKGKTKREFQGFCFHFTSLRSELRRRQYLSNLNDYNEQLGKLLQSSDEHAQLLRDRALRTSSCHVTAKLCSFWQRADSAFRALTAAWNCLCPHHETNLLLQHRLTPVPDFHLVFLWSADESTEVHRVKMVEVKGDRRPALRRRITDSEVVEALSKRTRTNSARGTMAVGLFSIESRSVFSPVQTGSGASGNSASPVSVMMSNLCLRIHHLDGSGYDFVLQEDRKYSISSIERSSSTAVRRTLTEILNTSTSFKITPRERLEAALVLASSFVQLFDSPWLQTLAKDEVLFLQDDHNTPSLAEPLLDRNTAPRAVGETRRPRRTLVHDGADALEQLGILLLELHFGQTIESRPERRIYRETDNQLEKAAFDIVAARMWQRQLIERNYTEAVAWCLGGNRSGVDWSVHEDGTDGWRSAMIEKVIEPLTRAQDSLSFLHSN